MKLTNEHQHVPVPLADGRRVEGIVQVRGVDLRVRGRGIVFESRRPVAVVVRTPGALRRLAIEERPGGGALLMAAVPLGAMTIRALLRRKKEAA